MRATSQVRRPRKLRQLDMFFKTGVPLRTGIGISNQKGHNLTSGGTNVRHFLDRTGPFLNSKAVGNIPKLTKTVCLARAYAAHIAAGNDPLSFLASTHSPSDVWAVHDHMQDIGYTQHTTALHCMMDLGYQVIKVDIVLARLFYALGWLEQIIDLPRDFTAVDLVGKGDHGSKYTYTKSRVYKPVIELAREITANADVMDLLSDIGWVTDNPLREFDIFMVKFGQVPEPTWGLTRNLAREVSRGAMFAKCPSSVRFKRPMVGDEDRSNAAFDDENELGNND